MPSSALGAPPSKIIAVHVSYRSRALQRGSVPAWPSYFLKPPSSLAASDDPVARPPGCGLLSFEGEVALVIGRRASRVDRDAAWSHVAWVTAANDFAVYDLRYADRGGNVRSKGIDGLTPLGPRLLDAREIDPGTLRLRTWKNGQIAQDAKLGEELLFGLGDIVADLSRLMTLEPGDVILTGTPAGSTVVEPGDLVEIEVTAGDATSGKLRSPIVEAQYTLPAFGAMPRMTEEARDAAFGVNGQQNGAGPAAGTPVLPAALLAGLGQVSTATLASQLRKRGLNGLTMDGLRTTKPGQRMAGFARTLRYLPLREDLFARYGGGMNAQKQAIEQIRPGEVLVIDARQEPSAGHHRRHPGPAGPGPRRGRHRDRRRHQGRRPARRAGHPHLSRGRPPRRARPAARPVGVGRHGGLRGRHGPAGRPGGRRRRRRGRAPAGPGGGGPRRGPRAGAAGRVRRRPGRVRRRARRAVPARRTLAGRLRSLARGA